jgi:uncharacterized membrane protein YqjE
MPAGVPGRVTSSSDPGYPSRPPPSGGLLASLRDLTDNVLGSVHDRFELLSIELHEEKHRLIHVLIWISATVFAAMLALIFASGVLVVAFWDTRARLPIIGGLAGAYVLLAIVGIAKCRRLLASGVRPFSDTLNELKIDRACLETKS